MTTTFHSYQSNVHGQSLFIYLTFVFEISILFLARICVLRSEVWWV